MRMTPPAACRTRLRSQHGFVMIVALLVLLIVMLLTAAVFTAVSSDNGLTRADLNGKRAYAAAQSGVQAYLYQLNTNSANPTWWETCANDTQTAIQVPGVNYTATYSYAPVATSSGTCVNNSPQTLVDPTTGTLRVLFTGTAGPAGASAAQGTQTIVASFKTQSPLSYVWYTVHETVDPNLLQNEGYSQTQANACNTFYAQGYGYNTGNESPPEYCRIYWQTGDTINGPMYTQDEYLIAAGGQPVLGRGAADQIVSQSSTTGVCAFITCPSSVKGTKVYDLPAADQVQLPTSNASLQADASAHGQVYTGTTTININANGTSASVYNCPSSSASAACTTSNTNLSLISNPIIYDANGGSGCTAAYDPTNVTYATNSSGHYYGPCGDVYIQGSYNTPLTIAAANDVILTGSLTDANGDASGTGTPAGSATVGLVANQYVRVMRPCNGGNPNRTIDAAILTLQHSFFVDNMQNPSCASSSLGQLTVNGAIAQFYRGIVATTGSYQEGYYKNYNYDSRLGLILPPYLFDLQATSWAVFRETACSLNSTTTAAGSCTNNNS